MHQAVSPLPSPEAYFILRPWVGNGRVTYIGSKVEMRLCFSSRQTTKLTGEASYRTEGRFYRFSLTMFSQTESISKTPMFVTPAQRQTSWEKLASAPRRLLSPSAKTLCIFANVDHKNRILDDCKSILSQRKPGLDKPGFRLYGV